MNLSNHREKSIVVKKFGGTSVGSVDRIEGVAQRIVQDIESGQQPIIVLSAMSGETNRLIRMASEVNPNYRGRAYDMLLASGEQVSISLLAMALEKRGYSAKPLLAYQIGIKTSAIFSNARIQSIDTKKIQSVLDAGEIPIIAGFQGLTGEDITTLGRGGSDTTAVAIASALNSTVCEIFTDVPAIFTADPRIVKKAKELKQLSFEEMMEMASLGSKVLHYRSVELAAKFGVKIHLRSTFEQREGTWVVPEGETMEAPVVSSVTHDPSIAIIKIFPLPWNEGFMADLFFELSEKNVVVDIITQSHNEEGQRLAFSVSESDVPRALEIVNKLKPETSNVDVMKEVTKISAVGVGMKNHTGVAARFFKTLYAKNIPIHLVTTSEIKMSAVVAKKHLVEAANALHTEFGLDQ
ncbi:MAG: aspartate kinase [Bdellovibrionaceae bacterium]|jgi:aspartate kinase|nr:aspartate kinase [Pseudobdellovibrionaceae bacterium]